MLGICIQKGEDEIGEYEDKIVGARGGKCTTCRLAHQHVLRCCKQAESARRVVRQHTGLRMWRILIKAMVSQIRIYVHRCIQPPDDVNEQAGTASIWLADGFLVGTRDVHEAPGSGKR